MPGRSLIVASLLVLAACRSSEHGESGPGPELRMGPAPRVAPKAEGEPRPQAPEPGEVGEDGEITFAVDWFEGSFEQALAQAKAKDKLIFLDVGAYWCPPCHELDETAFTDARVGRWLNERTIPLHVDAEKGEGPGIVNRYLIQAYPTLLVLEQSGIEKDRIVDAHPPDELLEMLEAIAAGGNVLAKLEAAAAAVEGRDDAQALMTRYRLGHAYLLAAKRQQAQAIFDELLAADPDNEAGVAARVLYDQALFMTLKLDGDPDAAIEEFRALQTRYPDSDQATRADRMIGRAHCKRERPDEAVAALEAMVARDPADVDLKASFGWFAFRQNCRPTAGLKAVLAGLEREPDNAELHYLEAELRRLLGQGEAALAAIEKASALEPDSAYYKRQVRRFEAP